jgi:Permuted papain-like amidase enzyme, YaeF/YiiX, C92 family
VEALAKQVGRPTGLVMLAVSLALIVPTSVTTDGSVAAVPQLAGPQVELLDGDVVFRRGVDAIGRMVLGYGDRPRFSHVGMVVRVASETLVVHALPETAGDEGGVRVDRLGTFSSPQRAEDVGYYRLGRLTRDQRREIHRFLLEHVGTPFDFRFEYSSDDSMYCTELVLKALAQVGVDVVPSLDAVRVITVDEPAFAPDALRRSEQLQELVSTTQ